MTNSLTRRSLLGTSAAVLTATTVAALPAAAAMPDPDAEIYRLAEQAAAAYAEYDRIREQGWAAELAGADFKTVQAYERAENPPFNRFCGLERRVRLIPAKTLRGVLFKLHHLTGDCHWGHGANDWYEKPIELAIADLEAIVRRAGR